MRTFEEKRKKKVVMLGLSNAGKTSIGKFLLSFNLKYALETEPSVNFEKILKRNIVGTVNIFIAPGQKRFWKNIEIFKTLLDDYDTILYVIDAADKSRIPEARRCFVNIVKFLRSTHLNGKKVLLVAHKQDIPGALKKNIIEKLFVNPVKQMIPNIKINIFETSIYRPASLIKLLKEGIYGEEIRSFDDVLTQISLDTRSEIAVLNDSEGLLISFTGNEDIALNLAAFSTNIFVTLSKEKKIGVLQKILTSSKSEEKTFDIILFKQNNKKLLMMTIPAEKHYSLLLSLVNFRIPYSLLLNKLDSIAYSVNAIYQRRYSFNDEF